jgi:hypothetical protein
MLLQRTAALTGPPPINVGFRNDAIGCSASNALLSLACRQSCVSSILVYGFPIVGRSEIKLRRPCNELIHGSVVSSVEMDVRFVANQDCQLAPQTVPLIGASNGTS